MTTQPSTPLPYIHKLRYEISTLEQQLAEKSFYTEDASLQERLNRVTLTLKTGAVLDFVRSVQITCLEERISILKELMPSQTTQFLSDDQLTIPEDKSDLKSSLANIEQARQSCIKTSEVLTKHLLSLQEGKTPKNLEETLVEIKTFYERIFSPPSEK